jgi:hypothetical protein
VCHRRPPVDASAENIEQKRLDRHGFRHHYEDRSFQICTRAVMITMQRTNHGQLVLSLVTTPCYDVKRSPTSDLSSPLITQTDTLLQRSQIEQYVRIKIDQLK